MKFEDGAGIIVLRTIFVEQEAVMPKREGEGRSLSWMPGMEGWVGPVYQGIARRLEEDVQGGKLRPHDKLPPQRELAQALGVNLSTVTRAYKVMEQKGLVYAVTGRGTFVAPGVGDGLFPGEEGEGLIELGLIRPFYQCNALVMEAARKVTARARTVHLLEYTSPLGTPWQRQAARKWLEGLGLSVGEEEVLLASGAQNALAVALQSLFRPGDKIGTDPYTYANFKGLAHMLGIALCPVENDAQGMRPDALDRCCAQEGLKGIYVMPSLSNPMGICMPVSRRQELAQVVCRRELIAIEDDIYGFLHQPTLPPLAALARERTVHICGTSKSLCAGLRVAFMTAPEALRARVIEGMVNINLKTVALNAEIIYELIESGLAGQIVERKVELARARNQVFQQRFPQAPQLSYPPFFRWIDLPQGMSSQALEILARQRGINLLGGHRFAISTEEGPAHARLAITSPQDETQLARGLDAVKDILNKGQTQVEYIV